MWSEEAAADLRQRVSDLPVKIVCGMDGLLEIASFPESDVVVTAVVGMIGIRPTIAAIESGKTIALANKETLVTAGHIIMPLAAQRKVPILPVDSEHSAIFQSLQGRADNQIHRILLTASGGPFRGKKRADLEQMTLEDALKHPNWSMGKKVTIDSASLVNKGLEVMEAKWLFDVSLDQIQVVVHPQSIVHSAVEYDDGAVIAQLGLPDMKLPIQYALVYPERRPMHAPFMDLFAIHQLTFEAPDTETFPGLALAYPIDGRFFCHTIEDKIRELPAQCPYTPSGRSCRCREKVYARTAIPEGTYKVTMEYSMRFKRVLPYLHDVPHFLGILIHSGNTEEDSAGCIIVGKNTVKGKVTESRRTSDALNALLAKASDIDIEIVEAWR